MSCFKMLVLAILSVALLSSVGYAQQVRGYPFVRDGSLGGAEALARAIETRDTAVLLVTPEDYLKAFRMTIPEANLTEVSELPAFVRSLTALRCRGNRDNVLVTMSRVLMRAVNGKLVTALVDLNWQRVFQEDEMCLFDSNTGRLVLSLYCGNPIVAPASPPGYTGLEVPSLEVLFHDSVTLLRKRSFTDSTTIDSLVIGERGYDYPSESLGLKFRSLGRTQVDTVFQPFPVTEIVPTLDTVRLASPASILVGWDDELRGVHVDTLDISGETLNTGLSFLTFYQPEQDEGRFPWVWTVGGLVLGGIAGYLACRAWCDDDSPAKDTGAPVNPPNQLVVGFVPHPMNSISTFLRFLR